MRVKRFLAPDMRQVLQQVREEFGADAVILSHEKKANGIELLAGCETGRRKAVAEAHQLTKNTSHASHTSSSEWYSDPLLEDMKEELASIKDILCDRFSDLLYREKKRLHPIETLVLARLSQWGFSPEIARMILSHIPKTESLFSVLPHIHHFLRERIQGVPPVNPLETGYTSPFLTVFHGQAGSGKTSALLKMAMQWCIKKPGLRLGFLSMHDERIAGFDPLLHYAKILDFPVCIIDSLASAIDSLSVLSGADCFLLDMPSFSSLKDPFRQERFEWLQAIQERLNVASQHYLVLDSKNDWASLQHTVAMHSEKHTGVCLDACVLSKLDETVRMGPACSALLQADLPVAFCSVSKKIPEGFLPWNAVWINQRFFSEQALPHSENGRVPLELSDPNAEEIYRIDAMEIVDREAVC